VDAAITTATPAYRRVIRFSAADNKLLLEHVVSLAEGATTCNLLYVRLSKKIPEAGTAPFFPFHPVLFRATAADRLLR